MTHNRELHELFMRLTLEALLPTVLAAVGLVFKDMLIGLIAITRLRVG